MSHSCAENVSHVTNLLETHWSFGNDGLSLLPREVQGPVYGGHGLASKAIVFWGLSLHGH